MRVCDHIQNVNRTDTSQIYSVLASRKLTAAGGSTEREMNDDPGQSPAVRWRAL